MSWLLGWANTYYLSRAWVVIGFLSLPAFSTYRASSPALTQIVHPVQQAARSWVSSFAVIPWGLAHPHSYHQGQQYGFSQARFMAPSANCCIWWGAGILLFCSHALRPTIFPAAVVESQFSLIHAITWHMREGLGPAFLSAAAGEGTASSP